MIWIFVIVGVLILLFGLVVFVGAPYLPTLRPQVEAALDLLDLKKGQTLLELGCGDGKVLCLAAERGLRVVGIEINPILVFIAWCRVRRYGGRVQVRWGNIWATSWPPSDGIFVFLIDSFMPKLGDRMQGYGGKLVSVAFKLPNEKIVGQKNGVWLYDFGKKLA